MSVLERFSIGILALLAAGILARGQAPAQSQDLNEQLLAAARKGDATQVKALLDKGASVNAKTRYGATPLSYACDRGAVEVVKILLERGADVNVTDTFYNATPMVWAAERNHAEVVKMLIAKGASKETAMEIAIGNGNTALAKVVLETGGLKPEALSRFLVSATRSKNEEMIALLKAAGAQPPAAPDYKVEPALLKSYEGTFKNDQSDVSFKVRENKLFAVFQGRDYELTPSAKHTFVVADAPQVSIIFAVESDKVTSLVLKEGNSETRYKKAEGQ